MTALVAVVGALFGIWQFFYQQKLADQERRKQQEAADAAWRQQQKDAADAFHRSLQRDTARPLWEKRLSLYLEASEMAAVIATAKDDASCKRAEDRFWVLYYGPLAAVEKIVADKDRGKLAIVSAMVKFGNAIDGIALKDRNSSDLHELSLKLAYAVQDAIKPLIETADQKNAPP